MNRFADQIKEAAMDLGIDKIGIVRAEILTEEGRRLSEWLGNGFQGEMKWMGANLKNGAIRDSCFPEQKR